MNIVAPCSLASSRSPAVTSADTLNPVTAPAAERIAGRGRSAGSSSTGTPASCSRQYASCPSSTSPDSHARCQTAKSAYCTRSGGSGSGSPRRNALYSADSSRRKMRPAHSSKTTWCIVSTRMWSSGANRTSVPRSTGPVARSNGRTASWPTSTLAACTGSGSHDTSATGSSNGAGSSITW